MKKILILTLILTLFLFQGSNSVYAGDTTGEITWTCNEYEFPLNSGIFREFYQGAMDLPVGVESFTIYLKNDLLNDTYLNYNSEIYNLSLRFTGEYAGIDELWGGGYPDDTMLISNYNDEEFTPYIVNLSALERPVYDEPEATNSIDGAVFTIPTSDCSITDLTTSINLSYMTYTFDVLAYGAIAWSISPSMNVISGLFGNPEDQYRSQFIEIPEDATAISLYTGYRAKWSYSPDTINNIEYYNEDKQLVRSVNSYDIVNDGVLLHDWTPTALSHVIDIPWSLYNYHQSNAIKYIRITLYDVDATGPLVKQDEWSSIIYYSIDAEYIDVNFYVDGEIFYSVYGVIGGIPVLDYYHSHEYLPSIPDKEFSHWLDSNGDVYDFQALTSDIVNNNTVNFYAVYIEDDTYINIGVDDPEPTGGQFESILDIAGFNDPSERVIVFAIVLILVTIALFAMKVNTFNILVVDAIIVAFFISMGLLPVFVSAIIIIVLLLLGAGYFLKGGGGSNE